MYVHHTDTVQYYQVYGNVYGIVLSPAISIGQKLWRKAMFHTLLVYGTTKLHHCIEEYANVIIILANNGLQQTQIKHVVGLKSNNE